VNGKKNLQHISIYSFVVRITALYD